MTHHGPDPKGGTTDLLITLLIPTRGPPGLVPRLSWVTATTYKWKNNQTSKPNSKNITIYCRFLSTGSLTGQNLTGSQNNLSPTLNTPVWTRYVPHPDPNHPLDDQQIIRPVIQLGVPIKTHRSSYYSNMCTANLTAITLAVQQWLKLLNLNLSLTKLNNNHLPRAPDPHGSSSTRYHQPIANRNKHNTLLSGTNTQQTVPQRVCH